MASRFRKCAAEVLLASGNVWQHDTRNSGPLGCLLTSKSETIFAIQVAIGILAGGALDGALCALLPAGAAHRHARPHCRCVSI